MPRKQKQYHYIYKTTNLVNKKYYYGMHSTDDLEDGYLGSGRRLRRSINKYGEENHVREILEFVDDRKKLIEREKEVVNLNEIAKEDCMNLMVGGVGGIINEEHKIKFADRGRKAIALLMKNDEKYRLKHSKHASETMKKTHREGKFKYDKFKGKSHSEETKQKMSDAKKGKGLAEKNSQFGTCWITKGDLNKKIDLLELNKFLADDWIKGRKM